MSLTLTAQRNLQTFSLLPFRFPRLSASLEQLPKSSEHLCCLLCVASRQLYVSLSLDIGRVAPGRAANVSSCRRSRAVVTLNKWHQTFSNQASGPFCLSLCTSTKRIYLEVGMLSWLSVISERREDSFVAFYLVVGNNVNKQTRVLSFASLERNKNTLASVGVSGIVDLMTSQGAYFPNCSVLANTGK